jgi:hypothetical protein
MNSLPFSFTAADWVVLGLIAFVPLLMALGVSAIRKDIRTAARTPGSLVMTKTTEIQRRKWRQETRSPELVDLLDDIDMLLEQIGRQVPPTRREHREAMRLAWRSLHLPLGTLLTGGLVLVCVLSAALMVIAQGPANPIP